MNRTGKLIAALPAGVDAFITTNERTCLYLSGFAFSDGAIFVTRAGAHLFTDFRYIEAAESETEGFLISTGKRFEEMRDIIAKEGIKTVGFEDDLMTVSELEGIKKQLSSVEFMPVGATVRSLAEHKDEDEIEKIKAAQRITDEAFTAVVSLLRYDMTEIEVAAAIEYQMKKRGAIRPSFETIAVSGTNSSRPHGVPRNVILEKGFLTMDFGCVYQGYCSDMTRTVVIGKADEQMKRLYNTVLLAQTTAINSFKEGMTGKELDKIAENADKYLDNISCDISTLYDISTYTLENEGYNIGTDHSPYAPMDNRSGSFDNCKVYISKEMIKGDTDVTGEFRMIVSEKNSGVKIMDYSLKIINAHIKASSSENTVRMDKIKDSKKLMRFLEIVDEVSSLIMSKYISK